ncbi:hypothetical protein LV779_28035 [Streptomyces thinghirensis]|nr:hypothetical protein [Streptomyces thinghirensis]
MTAGWSPDGTPRPDGRRRTPAPATVIVAARERAPQSDFRDFRGRGSPHVESVGSGRAEVLRDGRSYDAAWKRGSAADGTSFTTEDAARLNAEGCGWCSSTARRL